MFIVTGVHLSIRTASDNSCGGGLGTRLPGALASIVDFQASPAQVRVRNQNGTERQLNKKNKGVHTYSKECKMCLHALVKDTSESRALILEGREFHRLPVQRFSIVQFWVYLGTV